MCGCISDVRIESGLFVARWTFRRCTVVLFVGRSHCGGTNKSILGSGKFRFRSFRFMLGNYKYFHIELGNRL
jgi:hypothetical protein